MPGPALVTGAAGFIAGHLVRALAERGVRTIAMDHHPTAGPLPVEAFLQADLCDARAVARAVEEVRPEVVYHLGARSSVVAAQQDPVAAAAANILGTVALAEAASRAGARRFVFFSTGGAMYGEQGDRPARCVTEDEPPSPRSMYGATKLAAEHALHALAAARGLELSVLRPGNVYGPGVYRPAQSGRDPSGVIAVFCERMLRGAPVTIYGDGSEVRDYVHVRDVVEAAILAASGRPATCHVSTGRPTSNLEVFNLLSQHLGYGTPPRFEPARSGEVRGVTLSPVRAREYWGWAPTVTLETGAGETADWFRARLHAHSAA